MKYIDYNENDIQEFEYETTMISDGSIVGACELGKATIKLLNDSNEYSVFKGSWIKTVHGSFYIYDVKPVQEKINIELTCYDIKYKLDTLYEPKKYTFPLTLKKWRNSIFDNCGVKYDDSDFPNSDLILEKEPYIENGSSNRTVIKMIAQAGASSVITDKNDIFYFSWFTDNVFLVDDWLELTTEKVKTDSINTVVLGRGDTEDNVYYPEQTQNPTEFRIDNNYILDPQDTDSDTDIRYKTIKPIYNRINGFSYLIFDIRTQQIDNKLSLTLGDKIKYYDIYDNELEAYVMTKKITYLGGDLSDDTNYEMTLSAEKVNETSTDLSYSSKIENKILSVERKADKQAGVILDEVKKIDSTLNSITTTNKTVSNKNSLYIEDALEENALEFRVKGKSEQTTFTGKNLFNYVDELISSIHGLTSTLNKDGSITTTGIPTQEYFSIVNSKDITDILEDNQLYSLHVDNAHLYLYFQVQAVRKDGTRQYHATTSSKQVQFLVDKSTFSTYTISVIVGTSANWGTSSRTITNKYMLCKGTDTNFEPYVGGTSSPNPSYPQEINTIKGIENLLKDVNSDEGDGNYWVGYSTFDKNTRTLTSSTTKTTENFITHKISGVKSNTTYTLFLEIKSNGYVKSADLFLFNNQTKGIKTIRIDSLSTEFTKYRFTFTTNKDIDYSTNSVVRIDNNGSTQEGTEAVLTVRNVMLVEGTADEYVPHGNWLVEKITGKNKFDKNNTVVGYLNADGTINSADGTYRTSNFISIKPNIAYYKSQTLSSRIKFYDKNKKPLNTTTYQDITGGDSATSFTTPDNAYYLRLTIRNRSTDTYIDTLQLEQNTEPTEYEPYKEQNVLINLKNNELCSNKDLSVRDELVVNETETFIDKKIGKAIFEGSDDEGWVWSNTAPNQNNTIYFASSKADSLFGERTVLSNYFTIQNDLWNHDKEGIYYDAAHGNSIRIRINKTTASTVTEFKTWLSTHNLEIQGILSTPEKISLDKVDIPLFENINNLTLLEDLETDTSVKYLLKTPISEDYITRHEANAKIKITKDSITQLANETETNLNSVNQKYAETKLASDGLSISVADIQKNVNSQQEDISNINSNVNKTNSELNNLKNNINSTNEVVTKMNYSFGTKELTINKETDPVNTGISNKGMIVRNYTTIKTVANDKGLGTDDLIVTNTAQIGYLKFMKSTDENGKLVTDIHHLVSNIQQVSDLVGD